MSRWKRSSSAISISSCRLRNSARADAPTSWYHAISPSLERETEHAVHGAEGAVPLGHLGVELALALPRDLVVARAAVVLRGLPLRPDPPAPQHALQGRVERS